MRRRKMKNKTLLVFTVCMVVGLWVATDLWAQVKTASHVFKVNSQFGDRDVFEFNVNAMGKISIKANWAGDAPQLTLILNGPSRVEFARKDGQPPVALTFVVTERTLEKGTNWKVSIVNFSRRGSAKGAIKISYPSRKVTILPKPLKVRPLVRPLIRPQQGDGSFYMRNRSQFDINEVWLIHYEEDGTKIRTLITPDLSTARPCDQTKVDYNTEIQLNIPKLHDPSDEPHVTPYYIFEYIQERLCIGNSHVYYDIPISSRAFARGAVHVPGYTLVRETMFLFDPGMGGWSSRFEQVYRGPDGRLYLYRPGSNFIGHPEVQSGPILLDTLIDEGYTAYDDVDFGDSG
jgi:hypothetical protein